MRERFPGINPVIAGWKGQEITDFQEDLLARAGAHISEKWFYTHIKSSGKNLPRIDMLNILSRYAGYANWDDFLFRTGPAIIPAPVSRGSSRYFIIVPAAALVTLSGFILLFFLFNTRDYQFQFMDAGTREPILDSPITITFLLKGESPMVRQVDTNGTISFRTDQSSVRLVVQSPYYLTDTITRIVRKLDRREMVFLQPNDYALMIHFLSTHKWDDWEKRRGQLRNILDEEALICQESPDRERRGIALFSREEFIDRITMPGGSLKNMEITETRMKNGKIAILRFRIREGQP